ncbi:MAG: fused MFS/spermidine synthase [Actinomycetes bacterium]|nr:fused MFS/spermidine synthase [Actinomycetes bacterium]
MKAKLLLIAYTLSGVAALVYELGWMRELSAMLGATAYASGTMLAAYMLGLGAGALFGVSRARRIKRPLVGAAWAELAVAALSIVAFAGIRFVPGAYFGWLRAAGRGSAAGFLSFQFAVCFLIMVAPTFAMGTTYPLIMRAVSRERAIGSLAGKLYAVNTAGAIAGSLLATFAALPTIGVKGSLIAAAALSVVAAWLLRSIADVHATPRTAAVAFLKSPMIAVAVLAIAAVSLIPARADSPLGLGQAFYYTDTTAFNAAADERRTLYDREGIYSRVQVTQNPDGSRTLSNGALDEGTDNDFDRITTTMIAAVPAATIAAPGDATTPATATATAMVVGLGTGYTSQTYYDLGFSTVDTVEINPDVLPASRYFLRDSGAAFDTDRWRIHVDDARGWLLTCDRQFDCISSEPSWPWSGGVAALFTREFIAAAKTRLTPTGVYCQWLPNYLLTIDDVAMMLKTMRSVFPRVDIWLIQFPESAQGELLLVGHNDAQAPTTTSTTVTNGGSTSPADTPAATADQSAVKSVLDDWITAGTFDNSLITTDSIQPYADAGQAAALRLEQIEDRAAMDTTPLNTDDHSRLEYRVFWNYLNQAFRVRWGRGSVLEQ